MAQPAKVSSVDAMGREYDIDWLRVLAMGVVFLFHCVRYIDPVMWHVKNDQTSPTVFVFVLFAMQWMMPLFFVLAGFGTYRALTARGIGAFVRRRVPRLLVPLFLGALVLGPPQVYIERVTQGQYVGSFTEFVSGPYFRGIYGMGGNLALTGVHLWYLTWLLVFTLITLPLLWMLVRRGQGILSAAARVLSRPGAILVPAVLIWLAEAGSGWRGLLWRETSWFLLTYLCLFALGFLLGMDNRWRQVMQRQRYLALGLAVVTLAGVWLYWMQDGTPREVRMLALLLRSINAWCWLVAILGFGRAHLRFTHPALRYANEAVLPFYILHQPVIVLLGYAMRLWPLPIGLKFLLLTFVSLVVTLSLYEWAVRRAAGLRFLFGMQVRGRRVDIPQREVKLA
jgi:peptidoglycan/LPS O-acetylase OafA/YrhL